MEDPQISYCMRLEYYSCLDLSPKGSAHLESGSCPALLLGLPYGIALAYNSCFGNPIKYLNKTAMVSRCLTRVYRILTVVSHIKTLAAHIGTMVFRKETVIFS